MTHQVLFLNSSRVYVRVNDIWYDANANLNLQPGYIFLTGKIEEVLDYETYTQTYPESTTELYQYVTEKTTSGGFIRRVVDNLVQYAINPGVKEGSGRESFGD